MWDDEYRQGKWKFLFDPLEAERFIVLSKIIKNKKGSILDLGCGEGIILNYLNEDDFINYKGVDISLVAILYSKGYKNTSFEVCKIEDYYDDKTYDYIIASEVVYYLKSPLVILKNLLKKLSPKGIILLSIFIDEWNIKLLEIIFSYINVTSYSIIRNNRGTWIILLIER